MKPSPSMVVALIALFVSVSGVAYATNKLPANSVKSKQIVDGAVKGRDLAPGSVAAGNLAPDSVTGDNVVDESLGSGDLSLDSVTGDQLADGSVDEFAIQTDAVGSDAIAMDAVGPDEIMDGSVGALEVGDRIITEPGDPTLVPGGGAENASYRVETATAACSPDEEILSGYATWDPDDAADNDYELFISSVNLDPDAETVTVEGGNDSGVDHDLIAVAVCLTT